MRERRAALDALCTSCALKCLLCFFEILSSSVQGEDPLHYARTTGALSVEALRPLLGPDIPGLKACTHP